MNILLLTLGSAGDVHPFIGLGLALRQRGHAVKLITNPLFGQAAANAGLELVPLGSPADFQTALADPMIWHKTRGHIAVFDMVIRTLRDTYNAVVNHIVPDDTVLVCSSLGFAGRIAQDKFHIPTATVHLSPSLFRSLIAPAKMPGMWMPPWLPMFIKRQIWAGADRFVLDKLLAPGINALRAELGLPPVEGILRDFWNSPQRVIGLFPDWFAPPQADWPAQAVLTGFPRYDETLSHAVDPQLQNFLQQGDAPIVFTPGSAMYHGRQFFLAAVKAAAALNRRAILLTRHADQIPENLPASIRHFSYVPFSQLLHGSAALVHHGGIGTSAQAMAAGCPQLVTPFAHDQFDNAIRLCRLGVARTIPALKFTAARATTALKNLLEDPAVKPACERIAARFQQDDSLERTCTIIERLKTDRPADAV